MHASMERNRITLLNPLLPQVRAPRAWTAKRPHQWSGEGACVAGLLVVVVGSSEHETEVVPGAVAGLLVVSALSQGLSELNLRAGLLAACVAPAGPGGEEVAGLDGGVRVGDGAFFQEA